MKQAELKVIHFNESDVIATSMILQGIWDGTDGNVTFCGVSLKDSDLRFALEEVNSSNQGTYGMYKGNSQTGSTLYNEDEDGYSSQYNGYYKLCSYLVTDKEDKERKGKWFDYYVKIGNLN